MARNMGIRILCLLLLTPVSAFAGLESFMPAEPVQLPWLDDVTLAPLLFVLTYIVAQQLFISSVAFCLAGGLLFGPAYGSLLNLTGAMFGAVLSFFIARHLLSDWVTRRLPPALLHIRQEVEREGWRAVFFIRLLPVLPFTPLNYTFGLTRITLWQFLIPTLVCVGPRIIVYTYLGHTGRKALEGNVGVIWHALIALGVLAAISWLPHLMRLRQK